MSALRSIERKTKQLWNNSRWHASALLAKWREPTAVEFYRSLRDEAYNPDHLVRVLPSRGAIYVMIPKVASTRIRSTLGAIEGRYSRKLKPSQWGTIREAQGPRSMTVRSFYRLATNPATFRFSFVRNPYDRLLAVWTSGFRKVPLTPGRLAINEYLALRKQIDAPLPTGADKTLSFAQFTVYATERNKIRAEQHFMPQTDILSVPGIPLDFIGRFENFEQDFRLVLDRLDANNDIRREALIVINPSEHRHWSEYYTQDIADRVYRAYERDFDCFGYSRALPN